MTQARLHQSVAVLIASSTPSFFLLGGAKLFLQLPHPQHLLVIEHWGPDTLSSTRMRVRAPTGNLHAQ